VALLNSADYAAVDPAPPGVHDRHQAVLRDDFKITDELADEVLAWQRWPLEPWCPVIYLDAALYVVGQVVTALAATAAAS
jgi:hypothetical protein